MIESYLLAGCKFRQSLLNQNLTRDALPGLKRVGRLTISHLTLYINFVNWHRKGLTEILLHFYFPKIITLV